MEEGYLCGWRDGRRNSRVDRGIEVGVFGKIGGRDRVEGRSCGW